MKKCNCSFSDVVSTVNSDSMALDELKKILSEHSTAKGWYPNYSRIEHIPNGDLKVIVQFAHYE